MQWKRSCFCRIGSSGLLVALFTRFRAIYGAAVPSHNEAPTEWKERWGMYNITGGFCEGEYWRRWRVRMWQVFLRYQNLNVLTSFSDMISSASACPEGVASLALAYVSFFPEEQSSIVEALAEVTRHFNAPVLSRRLELGGWPDFGVAKEVLGIQVPKLRFPETASLLLDVSPRFTLQTASAPHMVLPGWWWAAKYGDFSGIDVGGGDEDSSIDLGMQLLLQTPILKMRTGLILLDVGAFDGSSLFSLGYQTGMRHRILAFEPLNKNRKFLFQHVLSKGGEFSKSFRMLDPDTQTCSGFDDFGIYGSKPCECNISSLGGCPFLVPVGLSAVDFDTQISEMGAFSSWTMETFAGQVWAEDGLLSRGSARFREGAGIVERWVRDVLGLHCVDIHLLKIDTEGCEFGVLRGLESLLAEHRVRFIFVELWPMALMTAGSDPLGVMEWLAHYGFVCRFLGTRRPETFKEFIQRHTNDLTMSDFYVTRHNSFDDLLCEDVYWSDPCEVA